MLTTSPGGAAVLSDCGTYRYRLSRRLGEGGLQVLWIMLNPSTADADVDDPTIRRCLGFSRRLGAGRMAVINLFALRATDPRELLTHPDPVGPGNEAAWRVSLVGADVVILAWGAVPLAEPRARQVWPLLERHPVVRCLGTTASGAPRHPLYLPKDAPAVPWAPPWSTPSRPRVDKHPTQVKMRWERP